MNDHIVETKWREADAQALEERVRAIEEWLDHTNDLVEMFGPADPICQELLTMSGLVRTRRNDVKQEAERMRALLMDRNTINRT